MHWCAVANLNAWWRKQISTYIRQGRSVSVTSTYIFNMFPEVRFQHSPSLGWIALLQGNIYLHVHYRTENFDNELKETPVLITSEKTKNLKQHFYWSVGIKRSLLDLVSHIFESLSSKWSKCGHSKELVFFFFLSLVGILSLSWIHNAT